MAGEADEGADGGGGVELKHCQICGRKAKLHILWNGFLRMNVFTVSCESYCTNIGWYTTPEKAIIAWNRKEEQGKDSAGTPDALTGEDSAGAPGCAPTDGN